MGKEGDGREGGREKRTSISAGAVLMSSSSASATRASLDILL